MIAAKSFGAVAVAIFDRRQDLPQLAKGLFRPAVGSQRHRPQLAGAPLQRQKHLGGQRIAGTFRENG